MRGSEMINRIATYTIIVSQKVIHAIRATSQHFYNSLCLKCPPLTRMQVENGVFSWTLGAKFCFFFYDENSIYVEIRQECKDCHGNVLACDEQRYSWAFIDFIPLRP